MKLTRERVKDQDAFRFILEISGLEITNSGMSNVVSKKYESAVYISEKLLALQLLAIGIEAYSEVNS